MRYLQDFFNPIQNQQIRRQPVYRTQCFFCKPTGCFVLQEFQLARNNCAQNAMHGQMEGRVIIINNAKNLFGFYLGCKLLADFAFNTLLGSFAWFKLSAREFPAILVIAVASLSCEYFFLICFWISAENNCSADCYLFHARGKYFTQNDCVRLWSTAKRPPQRARGE